MRFQRRKHRLASFGTAFLVLTAAPGAQAIRVNGELAPELRRGDVTEYRLTADGARVLYRADRAADQRFELFSVPLDGSGPSVPLNGPLVPGGQVQPLSWRAGAGDRVVFAAETDSVGSFHLFSAPADASAAPALLHASAVASFWLDSDGDQVYFRDVLSSTKVYRAPLDASVPALLVATLPAALAGLAFSPDGAFVLFTTTGSRERLFVQPADASAPPALVYQTESDERFGPLSFAPGGEHVVFDVVQFEPAQLYAARLDGSTPPVRLSLTSTYLQGSCALGSTRLVYNEGVHVFSIGYDGTGRADLVPPGWFGPVFAPAVRGDDVVFGASDGAGEALLRAPLDGSALGTPLFPPDASTESHQEIRILASGNVIYLRDGRLFVAPLSGGVPTPLTAPGISVSPSYAVLPDGLEVLFLADGELEGRDELYSAPLDGGTPARRASATFLVNGDVKEFALTPDGLSAVYRADREVLGQEGLFSVPLDGSERARRLDEALPGTGLGGDVVEFLTSSDGARAVYRADEDADEAFDLYALAFPTVQRDNLTAALAPDESVLAGFALSSTGLDVAFRAQSLAAFTLYGVRTDGGLPHVLDGTAGALPTPLLLTPNGSEVVYRKTPGGRTLELWCAPLDGSAPARRLDAPRAGGFGPEDDFQVSADGQWVVYRAEATADEPSELVATRLDGSLAPLRLCTLPSGQRVASGLRITPDSTGVVFRADLRSVNRVELFVVPLDGSFSPQRLSPPVPAGRSVADFVLSPRGERVIFRANLQSPARYDLYSSDLRGRRPPRRGDGGAVVHTVTRLSRLADANPAGFVQDARFHPDGTRVTFRFNPTATDYALYIVAADGVGDPVRLSEALPAGRRVSAYALSPDGLHAAYVADGAASGVFELYGLDLSGGPALRLAPFPAHADVTSFRITPDSEAAVFRADRDVDGRFELFTVPLDGSAGARRLSRQLGADGDVQEDFVALPNGGALHRADAALDEVFELYWAPHGKTRRR